MLTSWFYFDAFKTTLIKVFTNLYQNANMLVSWGATIAQWIRLRLPSCRPGFESQARNLRFLFIVFVLYLSCEKNENKQKEAGFGPFKKHASFHSIYFITNDLGNEKNCFEGNFHHSHPEFESQWWIKYSNLYLLFYL